MKVKLAIAILSVLKLLKKLGFRARAEGKRQLGRCPCAWGVHNRAVITRRELFGQPNNNPGLGCRAQRSALSGQSNLKNNAALYLPPEVEEEPAR